MGAAASAQVGPKPTETQEKQASTSGSGKGSADSALRKSMRGRVSVMGKIAMPQVKRAGTGERNFLGVALQFDNKKEVAPAGCLKCTCERQYNLAAIETSNELFVVEYIQEELKKVATYFTNSKQSGMTARGAKFMGPWFHADLETEIPLTIRHLSPPHEGAKWVEAWHVTRYIGYLDPYTRQKSRFRLWRRVGRFSDEHIEKALAAAAAEASTAATEADATEEDDSAKSADPEAEPIAPEADDREVTLVPAISAHYFNTGEQRLRFASRLQGLPPGRFTEESRTSCEAAAKKLLLWGANGFGQLGLGSASDESSPECAGSDLDVEPAFVSCFGQSSGFITTDGEVYTFGRSMYGSIGQGDTVENCSVPEHIPELTDQHVKVLSMGEFHMAAIDGKGRLWTAGRNWTGELGRGGDSTRPDAVQEPAGARFVDVACGRSFTAAVSEDGRVFTCGNGRQGVLGSGAYTNKETFSAVDAKFLGGEKAMRVAAGEEVLMVLTQSGKLYACGNDDYGKLGIGGRSKVRIQTEPQLVNALYREKIVQVSCGSMHCAAIDEKGALYTWGCGSDGRLGHGSKSDVATPTQVHALKGKKVVQVACGGSHTLALLEDGSVYAFGKGRNGQLAAGDSLESVAAYRTTPHHVQALADFKVLSITAGGDHSACITA
ncbi:RCC1 and BTB domain-containing protein 1 [Hondaea fermentalgiana]|uniref:RCC1 and BTB domain-containing protein 1 n=1 Tax=Hondaea fermentalgiana TaxID=2315210 RepID=A0A2R5GCN2_9STRA|nr:RCC1 and BTB domain-containing protein 1 [Hondaea fermentalgiana]|eukprot:GBG28740.1 RCC1 and BTB domain-containing protein 1 [Hondaea fermentalgiana]